MTPIGHLAVAFAAKPAAARVPLWVLLLAAWVLDFAYIGLAFLAREPFGQQTSVFRPWTHGLVGATVVCALTGAAAGAWFRGGRAALCVGLVAFSHWVLDFVMWPDLPLAFEGSPTVGLGWFSPERPLPLLVAEFGLLAAGVAVYVVHRRGSRAGSTTGQGAGCGPLGAP